MATFTRREAIRLSALGAASLLPGTGHAEAPPAASTNTPSSVLPSKGGFEELPFASVRPDGWLLQQLELQAAGITGHLEHLYAPFTGTAWTVDEANPATEWVPWEVRAYWCDGAVRCGLLLQQDELIEQASRLVKYTFGHPQSDGYLGPAFLKKPGDYQRWPHNVFFRSAMAWHDAMPDASIVEGLQRHYLQSPFTFTGQRNQTNIEAMLWTYAKTGDPKLLALAEQTWTLSQQQFSTMPEMQALTEKEMLSAGPVINYARRHLCRAQQAAGAALSGDRAATLPRCRALRAAESLQPSHAGGWRAVLDRIPCSHHSARCARDLRPGRLSVELGLPDDGYRRRQVMATASSAQRSTRYREPSEKTGRRCSIIHRPTSFCARRTQTISACYAVPPIRT